MPATKRFAFSLFVAASALATSGCGKLDFSQDLLSPLIPHIMSKAQGVELVSGSAVGQKTVINSYTVNTSVGSIQDKLVAKTPNGYSVYNGVQGSIVSDEAP